MTLDLANRISCKQVPSLAKVLKSLLTSFFYVGFPFLLTMGVSQIEYNFHNLTRNILKINFLGHNFITYFDTYQ